MRIELHIARASEQLDALRRGEVDIGFMRPLRVDSGMATETILREPVTVILSNEHRLLAERELSLATEDLLLSSRTHAPLQRDMIISGFRAANLVAKVSLETDYIQTILGLVGRNRDFGWKDPVQTLRNINQKSCLLPRLVDLLDGTPETVRSWHGA